MGKHVVIPYTTPAVAGSLTINYPAGVQPESFLGGTDHMLVTNSMVLFSKQNHFGLTFGPTSVTVMLYTAVLPANSQVFLHLDRADYVGETPVAPALANEGNTDAMRLVKINLGIPAAAVANGAVASQAASAATGLATGINGSLASGGVATFDVPRNVVAAWTGTAVLTVTGLDEYGKVVKESSASGTTFTGKKAFKKITGISVSADVTGLTVGSGAVLGLPVFLGDVVDVLKESQDGAAATAGTIAAGVVTAATATTGDVRGTYAPNSAPNAARNYELIAAVRNLAYTGVAQFAG